MFVTAVKGGDGPALLVFVQPKARKTGIVGLHGNMVKLAVASPPVDGKANREVIRYLAEVFALKKGRVRIVSGLRSRRKVCVLEGLSEATVRSRIAPYLSPYLSP